MIWKWWRWLKNVLIENGWTSASKIIRNNELIDWKQWSWKCVYKVCHSVADKSLAMLQSKRSKKKE